MTDRNDQRPAGDPPGRAVGPSPEPGAGGRLIGRAAFLGLVATGIGGIVFASDVVRAVSRTAPVLSGLVPGGGWRIYTVGARMPDIPPEALRLAVSGMVRRPTTVTLDELRAMGDTEMVRDFHCVTGWSVHGVRWGGVPLYRLLDHVGAHPDAGAVRFISAERPYEDSLTMAQARLPDVMLAHAMDGAPLRRPHGGPLRLVMPRMYGYKSVKWVSRIVVEATPHPGYWEQNGYDADAWLGRSNGA